MTTEHMRVLYKDVRGFYKGKMVTGFNIPEVRVRYKEPDYHVVKDICVDEGHPPHQKTAPPPLKNQELENKAASTGNSLYTLLQSEKSESDDISVDYNDEAGKRNGASGGEGTTVAAPEAAPGGRDGSPAEEVDGFVGEGRGVEECGDARLSISGAITFSAAPVVSAGNLSVRSDSSTTSTRSFTFPILQQEWNSSPVRMAEGERSSLVKHRWWREGLLCCRF